MTRINHKRRGLSGIVGAVFMVLVMIGALNVILLALRQQDTVTQAVIDKSNSSLDKLNEEISISDIRVSNGKLNMTVTNAGGAAATLKSVYLVNETANLQYRYDLDAAVDGRESVIVGQSSPAIPIRSDKNYSIKVVTEAGNSAVARVSTLGSLALKMSEYVIPPTITSGQNVTILYAVANNSTDSTLANSVSPAITVRLSCTPFPSDTCKTTQKVAAESSALIPKGSIYLFKWVYRIDAPIGTLITFNATLSGAKQGNYVIEYGNVEPVSSAQVAENTIYARLIQQPEILAVFPSPFGLPATATNKALWGAVIANPTDAPMDIRKVVVTLLSPRGQSQDLLFKSTGNPATCSNAPVAITPTGASYSWSCPATNTLIWKTSGSPLTISAHSVQSFLVSVGPGSLSNGGGDLQSYSINLSVFTNMGQFAKTGYMGTMREVSGAYASVYLSTDVRTVNTAKMIANVDVEQGQLIKVNATIADLDSNTGTKIDSGTKLVIDIPKDFTQVTVTDQTGFSGTVTPQVFSDGSWQITGTLSADLNGASGTDAKTIQFTMYAPTITAGDTAKLYVLYLLADGTSDNSAFIVGPVGETVIRVYHS
jgi:hypothetical protein